MNDDSVPCCAICLEPKTENDGWFLLAENRWTDRLKIMGWNDALVERPGVQAACGAAHVQQLVVHWMATGSLNYPFARAASHGHGDQDCCSKSITFQAEPDIQGSRILGELAVHRESLDRVLRESPESLSSILRALISALANNAQTIDVTEEETEEEGAFALSEV